MIEIFESRSRKEAFHIWSRPVIFDINMLLYFKDYLYYDLVVGLNNEDILSYEQAEV